MTGIWRRQMCYALFSFAFHPNGVGKHGTLLIYGCNIHNMMSNQDRRGAIGRPGLTPRVRTFFAARINHRIYAFSPVLIPHAVGYKTSWHFPLCNRVMKANLSRHVSAEDAPHCYPKAYCLDWVGGRESRGWIYTFGHKENRSNACLWSLPWYFPPKINRLKMYGPESREEVASIGDLPLLMQYKSMTML